MDLYPAIDIRSGACVRLVQGDYAQEKVYRADPVEVAGELVAAGARWLHVVDLDAARTGRPENRKTVAAVAATAAAAGVPVQSGGAFVAHAAAEALLDAGVARVVVGTAALEDPGMVRRLAGRHPGAVAVGLDARGGQLAVRGWTAVAGLSPAEALGCFEDSGVAAFVVTDIARDGMMAGPDAGGLAGVLALTAVPVIASGGVATLADLRALAGLEAAGRRLAGAVVGTALYEGSFSVAEALVACGR
ncbi:MAG TPA: HisA/HisF-related TIM barrel protein [Acidimicrobiales bacterium]|nr:HisA/HisF-related TIM barrel protein [Acidimicrobiales bacterium]